jgi:small subunit ribosomal protein S9
VIDDQPEDQPAPDAEESTPEVPEAPPEAEATGDASEASKVDADESERPAPPTRAQDPEGEPDAPETQPLGPGEPVAESEAAPSEASDETPRAKPEIPGADLEPDIVLDSDAVRGREEGSEYSEDGPEPAADGEPDDAAPQPIAGATINLAKDARYTATGKRKTAVARVILKPGSGEYVINGKTLDAFFPRPTLQRVIRQPLETVGYESRMDVVALMHGGGVSAQAGALRHGVARALIEADPTLRGELKRRGFLTRDPRVKERKKAGLKKARKRPQFSKR